jgi:hypothetical protein
MTCHADLPGRQLKGTKKGSSKVHHSRANTSHQGDAAAKFAYFLSYCQSDVGSTFAQTSVRLLKNRWSPRDLGTLFFDGKGL